MRGLLAAAAISAILLPAHLASADEAIDNFSVIESITNLERAWTDVCIEYDGVNAKRCVEAARAASATMHDSLDMADYHPLLKILYISAVQKCSEVMKNGSPRGIGNGIMGMTSDCVVYTFSSFIAEKGGVSEFLLWGASLGDPEV